MERQTVSLAAEEQIKTLSEQINKLNETNEKQKGDIDALKAQKKEQSLKVAKQAKENLMKQKED